MKDLIIKLEKRVEELAQLSWATDSAKAFILLEIRWLEELIAELEKK